MNREIKSLMEFHETYGCTINEKPTLNFENGLLRYELLKEENDEYMAAVKCDDIVEVADALTDQLYIVLGSFISHGLQHHLKDLFNEVHSSNMSKLDQYGKAIIRNDGKVLKGPFYFKPQIHDILKGKSIHRNDHGGIKRIDQHTNENVFDDLTTYKHNVYESEAAKKERYIKRELKRLHWGDRLLFRLLKKTSWNWLREHFVDKVVIITGPEVYGLKIYGQVQQYFKHPPIVSMAISKMPDALKEQLGMDQDDMNIQMAKQELWGEALLEKENFRVEKIYDFFEDAGNPEKRKVVLEALLEAKKQAIDTGDKESLKIIQESIEKVINPKHLIVQYTPNKENFINQLKTIEMREILSSTIAYAEKNLEGTKPGDENNVKFSTIKTLAGSALASIGSYAGETKSRGSAADIVKDIKAAMPKLKIDTGNISNKIYTLVDRLNLVANDGAKEGGNAEASKEEATEKKEPTGSNDGGEGTGSDTNQTENDAVPVADNNVDGNASPPDTQEGPATTREENKPIEVAEETKPDATEKAIEAEAESGNVPGDGSQNLGTVTEKETESTSEEIVDEGSSENGTPENEVEKKEAIDITNPPTSNAN